MVIDRFNDLRSLRLVVFIIVGQDETVACTLRSCARVLESQYGFPVLRNERLTLV